MGVLYKRNAILTLNTDTAWDSTSATGAGPAGPPGAGDIARWDTASLGGSYTGSLTVSGSGGVLFNGASATAVHTSGTLTLGSAGFVNSPTNTREWQVNGGVLAVGSTNQPWTLYSTTGWGLRFGSANSLTGSAVITVTNAAGSGFSGAVFDGVIGSGFTGTLALNTGVRLGVNSASATLTHATIRIDSADASIFPGSTNTLGASTGALQINNDVSVGFTGRTLTIASPTSFGGIDTHIATVEGPVIITGAITGTAGFTKAGTGTLTLSNTGNTLYGEVTPTAGTLTISGTVLANATLVPGAGTISTSAGTTVGALSGSTAYAPNSTITVGSAAANTTPNLSATYSGVLSGANLITKAGTGTWTVDGANTNTGGFTISAGTFRARLGGATSGSLGGTTGTITIASGAVLELNGNGSNQTFTKSSSALNVSGGTIRNSANNNTLIVSSGTLSTSAMLLDVIGGKLTLQCAGIISGATIGITKTGTFPLLLDTTTATFGGKVTLSAGTTEVTRLADSGTASSIGNGSGTPSIDVSANATLSHVGTSNDSTNRVLNFTGGGTYTLDSSGVGGSVTYTGTPTFATAAANTIALTGSNTSFSNLLSGTINNQGAGALTYITKSGAGTWGFGAAATLNFTGGLTVSQGTFHFGSVPESITAPIAISGGTVSNGTAAVTITGGSVTMTGGTVTAPLAGTGTLTINSGSAATMQPNATTGSNAQTGAITVSSGAVVRLITPDAVDVSTAGNGRAIGNGDVTCAGTIRTATSSTSNQKGQARYKSLTLNSGARIEVGAA